MDRLTAAENINPTTPNKKHIHTQRQGHQHTHLYWHALKPFYSHDTAGGTLTYPDSLDTHSGHARAPSARIARLGCPIGITPYGGCTPLLPHTYTHVLTSVSMCEYVCVC